MDIILNPFIERETVAANVRRAISQSGMSATQVAKKAGVHQGHLSRFLKTGRGIEPEKLRRIVEILNIDFASLSLTVT